MLSAGVARAKHAGRRARQLRTFVLRHKLLIACSTILILYIFFTTNFKIVSLRVELPVLLESTLNSQGCRNAFGQAVCCNNNALDKVAAAGDDAAPTMMTATTARRLNKPPSLVCRPAKVRYEASEQERTWLRRAATSEVTLKKAMCALLARQDEISTSGRWLAGVAQLMRNGQVHADDEALGAVFSKFVYTQECTDAKRDGDGKRVWRTRTWQEWIEPLTGMARHPFSMQMCNKDDEPKPYATPAQGVSLMSVDYVLLQSFADASAAWRQYSARDAVARPIKMPLMQRRPRNILIDLGSSYFPSSLAWFLCTYRDRGIEFDAVYAWEYQVLDAQRCE
jgi:hypothetical protein